jgi:hypothetical protein
MPSWSPLAVGGASVITSVVVVGTAGGTSGSDSLELEESPMMACCCIEDGRKKKRMKRLISLLASGSNPFFCRQKRLMSLSKEVFSHSSTDVIKTFAIFKFEKEKVKTSRKCD